MGSGKGTIGRILARKTGRFFLDADALIESFANRSIAEIFSSDGEKTFRDEERSLAAWLAQSVNNAVIAAGGGMPTVCDNLRAIGEVIYLKCDFDVILTRLKCDSEREKRPLAASIETLSDRFNARQILYERAADRVIDATQSVEAIVKEIV
jgi:shikimate kinase